MTHQEFLQTMDNDSQRERLAAILAHIRARFPALKEEIKWNQPMFTDHGTFIIAFSVAKAHLAVSPETVTIMHFRDELEEAGYQATHMIFRIKWKDPVDYKLLDRMIDYNINDKKDATSFWRTPTE